MGSFWSFPTPPPGPQSRETQIVTLTLALIAFIPLVLGVCTVLVYLVILLVQWLFQ